MTVSSQEAYAPTVHLNMDDIAVDDPAAPSVTWVTIKQSRQTLSGRASIYFSERRLPSVGDFQLPAGKGVAKRPPYFF